jgi:hypothetical protein
MSLFAPICKWTATVNTLREIPDVMRMAFKMATEGVPGVWALCSRRQPPPPRATRCRLSGPVFLEFPIDTLYPISDVRKVRDCERQDGAALNGLWPAERRPRQRQEDGRRPPAVVRQVVRACAVHGLLARTPDGPGQVPEPPRRQHLRRGLGQARLLAAARG